MMSLWRRTFWIVLWLGYLLVCYPLFAAVGSHRRGFLTGSSIPAPVWRNQPWLMPAAQAQSLVWLLLLLVLLGLAEALTASPRQGRLRALLVPVLLGYGYFLSLDFKVWIGATSLMLAAGGAALSNTSLRGCQAILLACLTLSALETGPWAMLAPLLLGLSRGRWPGLMLAAVVLLLEGLVLQGMEFALLTQGFGWALFGQPQPQPEATSRWGWLALPWTLAVLLLAGYSPSPGVQGCQLRFLWRGQEHRLMLQRSFPQPVEIEYLVAGQPQPVGDTLFIGPVAVLQRNSLHTRPRTLRDPRFYRAYARTLAARLGLSAEQIELDFK